MQLGITVVPVVGILSDKSAFDPVLNAGEVEAIFDAPLEMFLKVLLSYPFNLVVHREEAVIGYTSWKSNFQSSLMSSLHKQCLLT